MSAPRDGCVVEGHPIRSIVTGQAPTCGANYNRGGHVKVKPYYRWKWFGNKGIIVVLLWSFGAFSAFNYLFKVRVADPTNTNRYWYLLAISTGSLLFPLVGWLADVRIGRYRVVKGSLMLMWVGAILLCLPHLLQPYRVISRHVFVVLVAVTNTIMASGIGGFLVNIFQFSIDQLIDSSSVQIISFITWCVWTYFASLAVNELLVCWKHYRLILSLLFVSVVLTVSVASDFMFGHWLVKEPVTHNPLKLIFNVLRYSAKHKYPSNRNALSYWDDEQHSRMDLAKVKYGGPFTTNQVEDVKSFFRVSCLIGVACSIIAISLYFGSNIHANVSRFRGFRALCGGSKGGECLKRVSVTNLGYFLLLVCIPLYEFLILPMFWKCLPRLRAFIRMSLGGGLVFLHLLGLLSVEVVGIVGPYTNTAVNASCRAVSTQPCIPPDPEDSTFYWLALLSCLYSIGQCYAFTAGVEFIYSQTPYSMKGLMFGWVFTVLGVCLTLVYVIFLPFQHYVHDKMGCVFWFLLSCSLLAAVIIAGFSAASYCYKNRSRDYESEDEK